MGILDNPKIITGMKLKPENRPDLERFELQKDKPLGPYNFPVLKYAEYTIQGYKLDAAGLKHPVEWTERLPVGKRVRLNTADYPGITITGCKRSLVM
jgi:hypothetical protein